jgi:hypothetical protein
MSGVSSDRGFFLVKGMIVDRHERPYGICVLSGAAWESVNLLRRFPRWPAPRGGRPFPAMVMACMDGDMDMCLGGGGSKQTPQPQPVTPAAIPVVAAPDYARAAEYKGRPVAPDLLPGGELLNAQVEAEERKKVLGG